MKKKEPKTKRTFLNDRRFGPRNILPIDTVEYQEKIAGIYEHIKGGMRRAEIYAMMCVDNPKLTEPQFSELMFYAEKYAENAIQRDKDYVFQLHMGRYEDIFERALEEANDGHRLFMSLPSPARFIHWSKTVTNFQQAINALNHKEDLLGLHDKRVVLEFNDQEAVVIEKEETRGADGIVGYCLDNLSLQEQIELLGLIKEARTIPQEGVQRVVIKTTKIEINPETGERNVEQIIKNVDKIQEVSFEEMPPNVVERMDNIPEVEEEKEEEIQNPIKDVLPEDMPKVRKTAKQIKDKINEDIMKAFKDKLKQNKK